MKKTFSKKVIKPSSNTIIKNLKEDYSLPEDYSGYEVCFCSANCKTPCARKNKPKEKIYTSSDFTNICTKFKNT